MKPKLRTAVGILTAALALSSCGQGSAPELGIAVRTEADAAGRQTLLVSNATAQTWTDVKVVVESVEADGSATPCSADRIATWGPAAEHRIPACGDKTRITLSTAGASAQFVVAGGKLYRRLGRKEIPVADSEGGAH
jgi:hypothetical protein